MKLYYELLKINLAKRVFFFHGRYVHENQKNPFRVMTAGTKVKENTQNTQTSKE